jgi:hypothetical protein
MIYLIFGIHGLEGWKVTSRIEEAGEGGWWEGIFIVLMKCGVDGRKVKGSKKGGKDQTSSRNWWRVGCPQISVRSTRAR